MRHKQNGRLLRQQICAVLQLKNYEIDILKMYLDQNMSSGEIAEYINQNTPDYINITPRSIQRTIKSASIKQFGKSKTRNIGDAFHLAIARGRVKWAYKSLKYKRHTLSLKLRFEVLERDNYKCVFCGHNANDRLIEVDHIVPICEGGLSVISNLRTLCNFCNKGKQLKNKEK